MKGEKKMKKLLYLIVAIVVLGLIVTGCIPVVPHSEQSELDDKGKPTKCTTIQDGVLTYSTGHYLAGDPLIADYDIFGYNYQAHMFNGWYENYTPEHEPVEEGDTWLEMKWNDAWLSNKDCNDDSKLDRHWIISIQ